MGFRFRKSFGGKYFKVNISKSGIGYSYGIPGFRKTKLANGRNRTTISLKGTGISYVTESKGKNSPKNYDRIENYNASKDVDNIDESLYEKSSHEEFIIALKKAKKYWQYSTFLIVMGIICLFGATFPFGVLMLILGLCLYYYFYKNLRVNVIYEIEEEQSSYGDFKEVWLEINRSKKIWEIVSEVQNINLKVNSGAGRSVTRILTRFQEVKIPYLNVDNEKILNLKLRKKKVFFLKDKILIFERGEIASVDYKDIEIKFSEQRFVEEEKLPQDAEVIDYTWKYVNKNGQPDKRYSNNRRLPICLYGKLNICDCDETFNIELQISNYEIYKQISNKVERLLKRD